MVPGEGRLESVGFSKSVIDRLSCSRADSTKKQYRSKWTTFVAWAEKLSPPRDPRVPSVAFPADFLEHLFVERGIAPSSISNYKSAILFS